MACEEEKLFSEKVDEIRVSGYKLCAYSVSIGCNVALVGIGACLFGIVDISGYYENKSMLTMCNNAAFLKPSICDMAYDCCSEFEGLCGETQIERCNDTTLYVYADAYYNVGNCSVSKSCKDYVDIKQKESYNRGVFYIAFSFVGQVIWILISIIWISNLDDDSFNTTTIEDLGCMFVFNVFVAVIIIVITLCELRYSGYVWRKALRFIGAHFMIYISVVIIGDVYYRRKHYMNLKRKYLYRKRNHRRNTGLELQSDTVKPTTTDNLSDIEQENVPILIERIYESSPFKVNINLGIKQVTLEKLFNANTFIRDIKNEIINQGYGKNVQNIILKYNNIIMLDDKKLGSYNIMDQKHLILCSFAVQNGIRQ